MHVGLDEKIGVSFACIIKLKFISYSCGRAEFVSCEWFRR